MMGHGQAWNCICGDLVCIIGGMETSWKWIVFCLHKSESQRWLVIDVNTSVLRVQRENCHPDNNSSLCAIIFCTILVRLYHPSLYVPDYVQQEVKDLIFCQVHQYGF